MEKGPLGLWTPLMEGYSPTSTWQLGHERVVVGKALWEHAFMAITQQNSPCL